MKMVRTRLATFGRYRASETVTVAVYVLSVVYVFNTLVLPTEVEPSPKSHQTALRSVNSISEIDARIVVIRSSITSNLIRGGIDA